MKYLKCFVCIYFVCSSFYILFSNWQSCSIVHRMKIYRQTSAGLAAVVDSLFEHEITEQQLRSFDDYIANQCASIIEQNNYVECQSIVNADGAIIELSLRTYSLAPCVIERDGETRNINPMQARLRDITWSAPLCVDILHTIAAKQRE